ncbi:hypothetical protein BO94DRAFT_539805 [Aspergillus sclerotioniger CBS 115572]|uniref:Uncharacterized protein n=1 Tax=Aspergillus sclerotioniger CBS 115572 TaxID=1450535 RepID=A0A317VBL2_9EURO|nr:hypothetical protein BO94DRAFT_539805 [Aspergillus sclerotioniger CBS 115572]PWY70342.1 hypothetical protein BO94DRAFT_539805 [Aspergillus sclerotioniger CBS 115572]
MGSICVRSVETLKGRPSEAYQLRVARVLGQLTTGDFLIQSILIALFLHLKNRRIAIGICCHWRIDRVPAAKSFEGKEAETIRSVSQSVTTTAASVQGEELRKGSVSAVPSLQSKYNGDEDEYDDDDNDDDWGLGLACLFRKPQAIR